jgi:hypothetical protein
MTGKKTNCEKMWQYPGRKLNWRFFFPSPRGPLNGITIFLEETPCSLLNRKQGFRGTCSLHLQGRSVNSAEFLETLVSMYQTTRRHKTKVLYFCIHCHVKKKSKYPVHLNFIFPVSLILFDESLNYESSVYGYVIFSNFFFHLSEKFLP